MNELLRSPTFPSGFCSLVGCLDLVALRLGCDARSPIFIRVESITFVFVIMDNIYAVRSSYICDNAMCSSTSVSLA